MIWFLELKVGWTERFHILQINSLMDIDKTAVDLSQWHGSYSSQVLQLTILWIIQRKLPKTNFNMEMLCFAQEDISFYFINGQINNKISIGAMKNMITEKLQWNMLLNIHTKIEKHVFSRLNIWTFVEKKF